jgi:hypothetical protein
MSAPSRSAAAQDQVRVRLGVGDLVARDHRHVVGALEQVEGGPRRLQQAATGAARRGNS